MIVVSLQDTQQIAQLSEAFQEALVYVEKHKSDDTPDGKVEFDGTAMYAIYQTRPSKAMKDNPRFEAHKRYADVQFLVEGEEYMGWAPFASLEPTDDYNDTKDVVHGTVAPGEFTLLKYGAGQAVILFPEDAHAPGVAIDEPAHTKKIIVKVAL